MTGPTYMVENCCGARQRMSLLRITLGTIVLAMKWKRQKSTGKNFQTTRLKWQTTTTTLKFISAV